MSILKTLRGRTAPLNVKDLAELLAVTEATIQRWVRRNQVPAIRVGDVIRFDPGMLADWIELQAAASQRYQDGINRLIRMRDVTLEDKSFQITREDLGEGVLNRKHGPQNASAAPNAENEAEQSDELPPALTER
ncbi:MAG TPA: helix-turn-helix domain-containing protein [Terriglobales bacterium]